MKISARTLRKRIDSVLEKKVLSSYPILDQTAFVGFSVAIIAILLDPAYDTTVMMDSVLRLKTISEMYLLYMNRNGMLTILVCDESLRDLDNCIQEVKEHYDNFAVFTKFETLLNEHFVIDSNNNGHWK
jgi:DNA-binding Lrp family transcriptional regulator